MLQSRPNNVAITQSGASGDNFVVQIPSVTGHTYQLQVTPELAPPAWTNSTPSQAGNDGVLTFTDPGGATNEPSRFYRIQVAAP